MVKHGDVVVLKVLPFAMDSTYLLNLSYYSLLCKRITSLALSNATLILGHIFC